jgi:iron(III) transport system substrate-binding protein
MKKRLALFTALLLVLALFLSACGGDAPASSAAPDVSTPPASGSTADESTPPADEPAPTDALVVYSASSTGENELLVAEFNKLYPDIQVDLVSAGSGEIASRITAEAGNPQGDIMIGGSYSVYTGIQDQLAEYTSPNVADSFPAFASTNPKFTAIQINVNTIIVNNAMLTELGVTVDGWESLIDPALRGNITYADPAASSSGLEQLVNMLAAMNTTGNPDDGWDFIGSFIDNLDGKISSSSSAVPNGVVAGEYAVGLTNEELVIQNMQDGADVSPVYAKEGITLRTSYAGIIAGGANEYNARLMIDFLTSQEYQQMKADQLFQRSIRTDVSFAVDGIAPTDELNALEYPTDWVNENSDNLKTQFQDALTAA